MQEPAGTKGRIYGSFSFEADTLSTWLPGRYKLKSKSFFFFIQFNVPFKIISLIEMSQSIDGTKREYSGKTTRHTRKQNLACLTCGQCGARIYTRHSGEMIE